MVLVVEDSEYDIKLTLRALKQANINTAVHVVTDGIEAIDFLYGPGHLPVPPDLILLDIRLPKLSGLELLEKIRGHRETADVPIVMLTSSDDWNDIDQSYKLGANGFIRKAIDSEQYLEEVRIAGIYWTSINISKGRAQV